MGYDNTNSGALFENDRKRDANDRDHNGKVEVTCPHCDRSGEHWISAWNNTSRAGQNYMAVKFQPVESDSKPRTAQPSGGSEPGNRGKNADGTTKAPPREDYEPDDVPF